MFCAFGREDASSRGLTAGFGMTEDLGKVRLKTSRGKQLGSGCEAIVKTMRDSNWGRSEMMTTQCGEGRAKAYLAYVKAKTCSALLSQRSDMPQLHIKKQSRKRMLLTLFFN